MRNFGLLLFVGLVLSASSALADPIQIPLPLNSPVSIDLNVEPIVTFGTRTIDFTPNRNQEFIAFLIAVTPVTTDLGPDFRNTVGVRAADGLQAMSGTFPPSPDPTFVNQLPTFNPGTTNLLAFDLIIPGFGTPFSVSLVDVNGDTHSAEFANPTPEPASLLLMASGLVLLAMWRRRGIARLMSV